MPATHKDTPGEVTVNGCPFPWEEGLTVAGVIARKRYTFPTLMVYVNGHPVPEEDYARTPVGNGDDVRILHIMAGG